MIPIVIFLICFLVILLSSGSLAARFLRLIARGQWSAADAEDNLEDRLCLGLVFLVSLASAVSLFFPLSLTVVIAMALSVTVLGLPDAIAFVRIFSLRSGKPNWLLRAVVICWLGGMIFVATGATRHYDTGLYHAQMVKWNKSFGVVPGLTNLHARLGFNSSWDLFGAVTDQGYFQGRAFHVIDLVIGLIFLCASLRGFHRWWQGDRSFSTILRAFGLVVLVCDYRNLLPALSNDWPSALLIYYAFILTAEIFEQRKREPASESQLAPKTGVLAAVCFFTITVKFSTIPILLILFMIFVVLPNKIRVGRTIVAVALAVMTPFVCRNIVLSGYVLYPFSMIDLFNFSWKVPRADVEFQGRLLRFWAFNPAVDWYRAIDMSWTQRVQTWYHVRHREINAVIPWIVVGFLAWIGANFIAPRGKLRSWWYNALCGLAFVGLVYCFIAAPDPRFAMPWIYVFALGGAAWLVRIVVERGKWRPATVSLAGQIGLIAVSALMVRHAGVKRFFQEPLATLTRLNNLPSAEMQSVTTQYGVQVGTVVNGNQAWDAALPNTPELNPWLRLRGQNIKDGFAVTKPFVEELHLSIR